MPTTFLSRTLVPSLRKLLPGVCRGDLTSELSLGVALPPLPLRHDPPYAPEQMSVVLDGMIIKPGETQTPKLPNEGFHERSRRSRRLKRKEGVHGR
jgi:hypothetical protein